MVCLQGKEEDGGEISLTNVCGSGVSFRWRWLASPWTAQDGPPGATDGWPSTNYGQSANRYSPLTQITAENVATLQRVWSIHLKPADYTGSLRHDESIPLVIGNTMYLGSPYGAVIALDATTGAEQWRFELPENEVPSKRGVAYWPGDGDVPPSILFGEARAGCTPSRLRDGTLNSGFGENGIVDLKTPEVMRTFTDAGYSLLSSPTIYKNLVITGAGTGEGRGFPNGTGPAGDTRAWDARTGELMWTFHTVPRPDEFGYDTWGADSARNRSGVNVWGYMSLDEERGILYMPLGAPNDDRVGVDRPGDNLFSSSIVAVDANTGFHLWHFQLVHHDIWDYDTQSAPLVVDLNRNGETVPAVIIVNKAGLVFTLNRVTGEPIFAIEERPVPKSDLEGELASPTQPFPTKPEPLTQNTISRDNLYKGEPRASVLLRTHGRRQRHEAGWALYANRRQPVQHLAAGTGGRRQLLGTGLRSRASSVRVEHHQSVPADAPHPAAKRHVGQLRAARRPSSVRRSRQASAVRADTLGRARRRRHGDG